MGRKVLVISDTHGSVKSFERIMELCGEIDLVIHAGDYLYHGPRNRIPQGYDPAKLSEKFSEFGDRLIGVKGNCDAEVDLMLMGISELPAIKLMGLYSKKLLIFHGHRSITLKDAEIIIRGHTHIHELRVCENKILMNPGSPSLPKDGTSGTFGMIEFEDVVRLCIYDLEGTLVETEEFK